MAIRPFSSQFFPMSHVIDYAAILRGQIVIASIGDLAGLSERDIVRLLPGSSFRTEQKISLGKLFSFTSTPGLTYVAVSPQSVDKQRPLLFLDTLSRRWAATFGAQSSGATDHSLDQLLATNFTALFNDYVKPNKTAGLVSELEETRQVLTDAVAKGLNRSAELEEISSKGEALLLTSEEFRAQATNLKWKMRWQYIRSWIIWVLAIVAIVYFVLSRFCGGWRLKSCI
jgi:vesicle-associated membrane protein 7